MGKKRVTGYTKKGELFKNWKPGQRVLCPVCGIGYITHVLTGISTIYVHGNDILCQEWDDEIST